MHNYTVLFRGGANKSSGNTGSEATAFGKLVGILTAEGKHVLRLYSAECDQRISETSITKKTITEGREKNYLKTNGDYDISCSASPVEFIF